MKLLVGVPTHRRPAMLRECLQSLAGQIGDLPDVEVMVADNDAPSAEGASVVKELATAYPLRLFARVVAEPGISAVRNAILEHARVTGADFIAMIDDDETASPNWLADLLSMQRETGADVVGGPVESRFAVAPERSIVQSRAFRTEQRPAGLTYPIRGTGNVLIATAALAKRAWPSFDSSFGLTGGGDTEWFMRLAKLNVVFAWAPTALAVETVPVERADRRWILQRAYRAGNCNMRVALKHRSARGLLGNLLNVGVTVGSAPLLAPLLLAPQRRLWLLRAWWTAAGRLAALTGGHYREYAVRHELR
jgi:glycosyltransferase involved in cell wall biosynthesis